MKSIAPVAGFLFLAAMAMFILPQVVDVIASEPATADQQQVLEFFPMLILGLGLVGIAGVILASAKFFGNGR